MYREQPPPPALAGVVECLWQHERATPWDGAPILPDGRVDLIWTDAGSAWIAGPQTAPAACPFDPPFAAMGVRFHPGVAPALLGLPAHELLDAHVPVADVDTGRAAALRARLARGQGAAAVAGWVADQPAPDPLVRRAAALLGAGATVADVARELALSERQLQRRFRDAVGYGPKTLQRILRFRRFLAELARGGGEGALARAAADAGYADQPHLTRETRRLAALTPAELARRWAA